MNYNNILLINTSNIILKNNKDYYCLELPKNILYNGVITNYDGFSSKYLQFLKQNKIKLLWNKDLLIICNAMNNKYDKDKIYYLFKEINYRTVKIMNENSFLKVNQNNNYLIMDDVIRLFYLDKYNVKRILILDSELYYPHEIRMLIANRSLKKTLYIIGKFDKKYIADNLEYYYFENLNEFFLENHSM